MPRPTKQELQDRLNEAERTIDEIAGLVTDPDLSEAEKLEAVEELVFDDSGEGDGENEGA